MTVNEEEDGSFLMMSDGSPTENDSIVVMVELLNSCSLPDDKFNKSFGCATDPIGLHKNYIYLPEELIRKELN